ncbi:MULTISPECIES: LysR family transcriptional regulator [unclassified Vibrio]|uniref:LysR family transcriptional regulator n=1 Tax=unclassified Vibrio TaxID=2614977 RepID=UPI0013614CA5|nr:MULTISPECIES: LysR family transcriptional regulator [unclassified Vibrio]NAW59264.1 LysR family transcriptional regulator [Vibrio sp. V36_P2S2PM302]NAX27511.1 LysR family transcriptional regulator [Vibrio sp. V38_P2S17PM301]NAX32445.1 LysR family transcriptional regulator [Vibrio sp. V37_P2S8PM304]
MRTDINWRSIDLNLLVSFSFLYQYRSVSLAAEQCHVSQSAMSHSLSRLRQWLNNPLFERRGYLMEPTEVAHQLAPIIERILCTVQSELLTVPEFIPAEYQGVCRIGLTDYAEFIYAPDLYDAIHTAAPQAQVSFVNVNRHNYQKVVEEDKLDLVIGSIAKPAEAFETQWLYTEQHVCLFDPNCVSMEALDDVATFASIEQALVSPDGQLSTPVDASLAEHGLTRRVTVASRNFLTIRSLLSRRPLVAIVPRQMALASGFDDALAFAPPPVAVGDFDISMLWLKARTLDDKSGWLRQLVQARLGDNGEKKTTLK